MNGVLVGSDASQEWLLPWFWEHYSSCNDSPVAFADFGMSEEALLWCKSKGEVVSGFPSLNRTDRNPLWEKRYGQEVWKAREAWFKKPFALLASPFEKTVWIDLDCEVLSPLDALFGYDFAIAKERNEDFLYNSGVIVYKKNLPLIQKWADVTKHSSHLYLGDQEILSHLICQDNPPMHELPSSYNWRMTDGLNLNAHIIHFAGAWGKTFIKKHGGLRSLLQTIENENKRG